MNPILVLVMTVLQSSVVGDSEICSFGEKLHTSIEGHDNCIICEDAFMPEESHTNRQCYNCTRVENPSLEIETQKCNRTHDAVIDCICGYYRYIARRKGEKDECKPNQVCQLPVHPSSSDHRSIVENTTIGVTVDADNMTKGPPLLNFTLDSVRREQLNNAVTESQKPASHDVVTLSIICVTLFLTLASTFYRIFWNDKPNAIPEYSNSEVASSRFTTHTIVTCCVCALLSVTLIVCLVFKTVNTQISDVGTDVFVVITLAAAEMYFAVINVVGCGGRRPNKRHGKEESRPGTLKDSSNLDCIPLNQVNKVDKEKEDQRVDIELD